MASHHDSAERTRRRRAKSEYFMKPGRKGEVSVFRRPAGNRIEPKLCGTMPSKALALALVRQLEQAESVVNDLFLEATDDGIEALEAILRACRESVERRAARHQHAPREPRRRRGQSVASRAPSAGQPPAGEAAGDAVPDSTAGDGGPRRGGPRRRRSRTNRRGRPGPERPDQS